MLMTRVMPCLLLKNGSLVKTIKFKDPGYIGDPINAVRIYNEKEVDELIFLDISATLENRHPSFDILGEIASECFMPVAYGGGVRDLEDIKTIFTLGIEKVAINSFAIRNPEFVRQAADRFGSQSIVVSLDVRKRLFDRYEVFTNSGKVPTGIDPVNLAVKFEQLGAGELLITSIDRDGTQEGYDIELIKRVSAAVTIPVIACGGAGKLSDLRSVVKQGGASACALGSMVVYFGRNRAVLINYPEKSELKGLFT
jgi:cyclase